MTYASDVGLRVGDKIIYKGDAPSAMSPHHAFKVGSILTFVRDNGTNCPYFSCEGRQSNNFNLEARIWEKIVPVKEQKLKFDVAAHAKAWSVSHEEASKRIQEWLFAEGCKWCNGVVTPFQLSADYLFLNYYDGQGITQTSSKPTVDAYDGPEATLIATTSYQLSVEQPKVVPPVPEKEYIEFNGKRYEKEKLAEALKMLDEAA